MYGLALAGWLAVCCHPSCLSAQRQDSVLAGVRIVQPYVEIGWDSVLQPKHNPLKPHLEAELARSFATELRKVGIQVGDNPDNLLVCSAKAMVIGGWAVVTWDVALIERAKLARLTKPQPVTTWVDGGVLYTEPDSLANKYAKLGKACSEGFTQLWVPMNRSPVK